ncbi:MAG: hypothetical protein ACI4JW_07915 [Oscillospiraceae bacterium]
MNAKEAVRYIGWFYHPKNDCAKGYHSVEFDTMDDLRAWEEKYATKLFDIRKEVKGERGRWYRI